MRSVTHREGILEPAVSKPAAEGEPAAELGRFIPRQIVSRGRSGD